jgi:hypothetical protein
VLKKLDSLQSIISRIDPAVEPERYQKYKAKVEELEIKLFS